MTDHAHEMHQPYSRFAMNRAGLWLFFVSEAFMFAGILAARFSLFPGERPDLDQTLGLIVTSVLLLSSFFMYQAETAIKHGDQGRFVISTALTAILGIGFLIGVVVIEWPLAISHGLTPDSGVIGAMFFFMTGMHAFHVFTGVIFILIVLFNGMKGFYSAESHWGVESCALYWHFVDVVWVFFYVALYLIGTVPGAH